MLRQHVNINGKGMIHHNIPELALLRDPLVNRIGEKTPLLPSRTNLFFLASASIILPERRQVDVSRVSPIVDETLATNAGCRLGCDQVKTISEHDNYQGDYNQVRERLSLCNMKERTNLFFI